MVMAMMTMSSSLPFRSLDDNQRVCGMRGICGLLLSAVHGAMRRSPPTLHCHELSCTRALTQSGPGPYFDALTAQAHTRDKRQVQGVWRSCECFLFAPKEKGTKECNKTRNWIILLLLYFGWKVTRWQRSDSAEDIKCPITIFQLQLLTRSAIL